MKSWVLYVGFLIVFLLGIMLGIILMLDEIKINLSTQESELKSVLVVLFILVCLRQAFFNGYLTGGCRDRYYKKFEKKNFDLFNL